MNDLPAETPPEERSKDEMLSELNLIVEEFMLTMSKIGFDVTRDIIDIRQMYMINLSCVMQKEV